MALTIILDVVVLALLLWRQWRVRPVRSDLTLRIAVILGIVGVVLLISYATGRHITASVVGVLAGSILVGGVVLGALRASSVHIWQHGPQVLRQGTWLTMILWLGSIALHLSSEAWIHALHGPSGLTSASLLLWLGVTFGVQGAVVRWRADRLAQRSGPGNGRVIDTTATRRSASSGTPPSRTRDRP